MRDVGDQGPEEAPAEPALRLPADEEIDRWVRAYLRHAPLSLTLREVNRLIAVEAVGQGRGPVLDVGCGDGFWWTLREAAGREVYGIDVSAREIAQAQTRIRATLTDVSRARPFPDVEFSEIIGNCSLEHVRDIDAALRNLRHSAAPGARLLMFVPTPSWAYQGHVQSWLLAHAPRLAMTVAGALNGFFQHWHLYDAKVWVRLLAQNGWRVRAVHGLGSARSELMFRLFLPPAFGSFLLKQLTGFYPSRLGRWLPDALLAPAARLMRWAIADPLVPADSPTAYEYLLVAEAAELPAELPAELSVEL
ncbi:MAG: methyltransferase domain-containing protein [Myxococcales bacterium]|nr:methyltransferase domain-containing protein [Myxococcales bacterium]HRC56960.1 class I SAM-dependent methyltransferase [Kofleriaceae bacterium]